MAERTARAAKETTPAVQSLGGRVPALSPLQAQALRRFFGAPQRWFLDDGGLALFTPGLAGVDAETFTVDADGTALQLRFESGAPPDAGLRWSDYSGRSRLLAWSLAHESQLMRLSNLLGLSLLPSDAMAVVEQDDALWIGFAIDDEVTEGALPPAHTRGAMRLPTPWLERVLARAEPVYADDPLPELADWLGIPAAVTIGFAGPRLRGEEWSRLRIGDVIVAGNRQSPVFEARSSQRVWPLQPTSTGWSVAGDARPATAQSSQELPRMSESETPQDEANGAESAESASDRALRSLPVQVVFDIGQIELSMGDLASLQPGYVFSLPAHLEGANVTIRANGHAAGRGEVVAIGDTLGVRLLSWN